MVELLRGDGICLACARKCDLHAGPGFCGVRRLDPRGHLVVDEAITHVALQPIERKPLYHYRPGVQLLTIGSWGCGTRCSYCRNADVALARRRPLAHKHGTGDLVELAIADGAAGVAFSYNEPLTRAEQVAQTCAAARARGLEAVVVTSAWATPEALELLIPVTTAWRVDLKAASERSAVRIFGEPGLPWSSTIDALRELAAAGRHVEVSLTFSPEIHDRAELADIAELIVDAAGAETALHLQPLLPAHRLRAVAPLTLTDLLAARDGLRLGGLRYVYVHYLGPPDLRATWCTCGACVIRRGVTQVRTALRADGRCAECGAPTPIKTSHVTASTVAA